MFPASRLPRNHITLSKNPHAYSGGAHSSGATDLPVELVLGGRVEPLPLLHRAIRSPAFPAFAVAAPLVDSIEETTLCARLRHPIDLPRPKRQSLRLTFRSIKSPPPAVSMTTTHHTRLTFPLHFHRHTVVFAPSLCGRAFHTQRLAPFDPLTFVHAG